MFGADSRARTQGLVGREAARWEWRGKQSDGCRGGRDSGQLGDWGVCSEMRTHPGGPCMGRVWEVPAVAKMEVSIRLWIL